MRILIQEEGSHEMRRTKGDVSGGKQRGAAPPMIIGAKIELNSPTNKSCDICLSRRWTKPLRGRAGGRSPAIGDLPALISQLLFL